MQQQLQQQQAERSAIIRQLEDSNPGYEWDETVGRLVPEETAGAIDAANSYPEFTPRG